MRTEDRDVLRELIESGQVTPAIDRTYPLRETAAAFQQLHEGRVRGKVVITILREPGSDPEIAAEPSAWIAREVQTLAGLSRFVVADLSGPSVPLKLDAFVPNRPPPSACARGWSARSWSSPAGPPSAGA